MRQHLEETAREEALNTTDAVASAAHSEGSPDETQEAVLRASVEDIVDAGIKAWGRWERIIAWAKGEIEPDMTGGDGPATEVQPVDSSVVEIIVEAGLHAPSSKNAQPWRMHAISDRAILAEVAEAVQRAKYPERYVPVDPGTGQERAYASTVAASAAVLQQVPLGIFVENVGPFSGGRAAVAAAPKSHRLNATTGYGFEMVSIGCAIENMWLTACEKGLGGVFMGDILIAEDFIRDRLGIEGDLVGVLALGYATEPLPREKPLREGTVVWHT